MKKWIVFALTATIMSISSFATASEGHKGHGDAKDPASKGATFKHEAMVDGIHSEFQIMSLESMNMKDPEGNTHHIMVKLFRNNPKEPVKEAVGKIKVISPSGKEQIGTLKNYSGIFAANFTFPEKGKYGIICLLKVKDQKVVFKFWYPHG